MDRIEIEKEIIKNFQCAIQKRRQGSKCNGTNTSLASHDNLA